MAGFTRLELIVAVIVIAVVAIVLLPGCHFFCCARASNDRQASTSLKMLAYAQADFRANDRDGNGVNDYWIADVKGLYTLTSAAVPGAKPNSTLDSSIKLIELSVASADADGTFFPAGGENLDLSHFAIPSPKAGYWFAVTRSGPSRALRHEGKFSYVAIPDSGSSGKYVIILNENNTVYRSAVTGPCRTGTANPPGLGALQPAYLTWPDEATLKSAWSKLD